MEAKSPLLGESSQGSSSMTASDPCLTQASPVPSRRKFLKQCAVLASLLALPAGEAAIFAATLRNAAHLLPFEKLDTYGDGLVAEDEVVGAVAGLHGHGAGWRD